MKDKDYQSVLEKLTLEQKAALCSGKTFWLTKPIDEAGIPEVWLSDGPSGLRKERVTGGTNIMQTSEPATCFPGACATAASWDTELLEEIGDAVAKEAKALKVCTVLGPGVNIKRSPLCGRNFEYFSEDPYLAGHMGAAWVHGIQKNGIGTSLKHFAANNQEHLRMSIDTLVDERALREIYLPAFEHIVKTEQPATVMCSYNRLNGEYLSDSKLMLTDILRTEWGYKGIVVSDWGAVNNRVQGVKAGLDLEMPGNKGMNDAKIIEAVKNGELSEAELNTVVLRMIKFAIEMKEREDANSKVDLEANHRLARKAAAYSAVLLKNEAGVLPVKKTQSVAVIGKLASKLRYQGGGSSHINATKIVSFTDAMDEAGQDYAYADGYSLKGDGYSSKLIKEAVKTAKGKDIVLAFIGLTDAYESEGYDRSHINLPDSHNILIEELLKVNPNVVVVLSTGSPVKVRAWEGKVKAILNLYLGGQAGGAAAYDVLYGAVNPSGKLPETFPLRNHDNLVAKYFPMGPRSVEYRESVYVGYRYFSTVGKRVQYPFGFGLSYTTFEYSNLKLSSDKIKEGTPLTVTFTLKNTGAADGAEIAQLYVSDLESTIFRPKKELKGFKKVFLKAGEAKEVSIELDSRAFSYYNVLIHDWHIESGDFEIQVGASSEDVKLSAKVFVQSAKPDAPVPDYKQTAPFYYNLLDENGHRKKDVPDADFTALLKRPLVGNKPFTVGELTENNSVEQVAVSPVGRFLYKAGTFGAKIVAKSAENPEMIIESVKDMPLRSFAAMTGGIISFESLEGLVDMVNRKKGGFRKFMKGRKKK